LSITDFGNPASPLLTFPILPVMEIPAPLPTVDVLIGLDILRTIRLVVDGPGGVFTLGW
jgi:hypothetical protein